MIKLLRNMIVSIFIILALFLTFREVILKAIVRLSIENIFGVSVSIDKLKVGILKPIIDIGGLKIGNAEGFDEEPMLDIPEFYANYGFAELIKGNLVLKELKIDLKELHLIRKKDGSTNIGQLKAVVQAGEVKGKRGQEEKKAKLKIGLLELRLGHLIYKDYATAPPLIKTYNINIHKEFHNIDDPRQLVRLIIIQSLLKTNISGLGDVDLSVLQGSVKSILNSGKDLVLGTASVATGVVKGAIGSTTTVLKKTMGTIENILPAKNKE